MEECCKNQENLYVFEARMLTSGDAITRKCRVCKRRHFELVLDPGTLGIEGTAVG